MAGIDNNTVLYLRGDSFNDLSPNPKSITNNGATINNNGKFNKGLNLGNNQYLKVTNGMQEVDLAGDFTIEWWEYSTGASVARSALLTNRSSISSNYCRGILLGHSGTELYVGSSTTTTTWNIVSGAIVKDKVNNVWVHWRLVKQGSKWTSYKDGTKFWSNTYSTTAGKTDNNCTIGAWVDHSSFNTGYNAIIEDFRICNYALCESDFVPPSKSYNSITINKTNQTATNVNFSVTKLGQETINKVEVLQDNEVKATYTEGYDNLIYNFEGSNDVTIRVTYDDNYTEEKTIKVGNSKAKIYLYKEGNECTSLTGGIVGKYNTDGTFTLGTFTKQDKYISCVNNSTTKQVYVTSANKIDLTNYCNFICDFDVVNVRNTSSDVYKPTLTVRSKFTGSSDLLTRGKLIAGLRQILTLDVTDINYSSNVCFQTHANDYNIYKMYLETKENVLTINSQENDVITFSAKDLGLVTINKIDVLVNGVVSKTYTDNYSNLSYTVDKSLYCIGNNNIEIRVTYSQGDDVTETVSEYLTYKYDVSQLPLETPLIDTVERVKLLTKSKQNEKNLLSSILTSKNVEVSEEDKMSDLIGKVDLLGEYDNPILYLYKDGDECTDVTGGWSTTHTSSYYTVLPFTKESKNLLLNATNVATNTICLPNTVNLIDLTKYSKLKCEVEWVSSSRTLNSFGFRVTKTTTDDSELCVVAISNTKIGVGKFVCELDITNVTQGSVGFYLDQQLGTNNTGKIYKVWLEK